MKDDIDNEEFIKLMNDCFIETGEYDELFANRRDDEMFPIYRFLTYVVREATDEEIESYKGKYLDEIDISEPEFDD